MTNWIRTKDKVPNDYNPYLCVLRMNDMGDYPPWQMVLHYDYKNRFWSEGDPAFGVRDSISDWWTVVYWKPLEWPELV